MSSSPGSISPKRGPKTPNKMNRSQLRAMEVRAAETVISHPTSVDAAAAAMHTGAAAAGSTAGSRKRLVTRTTVLTRERELAYIRADLHRMIITAGALLLFMIVLLFIVEN